MGRFKKGVTPPRPPPRASPSRIPRSPRSSPTRATSNDSSTGLESTLSAGAALIPQPTFDSTSKILAEDVNLTTLCYLADDSASVRDAPDKEDVYHMQSAFRAEEQRRYEFDVARQKKQATLQRERARAGLAVSEDPIAEVQQPRIRLHREEQEVAVGMRLRPTWSRDWTTMTLKPDSLEEGEVQALIDLVNREVGDNQKFYLNKRFCLKRYSESSAATVQPGCIVYDDPHQDVSMFKYPITPSTQGERRMMDYMSCCMSSGKGVYNWINALGSSIANRDQDGQPFSTEIKLYLIHRPMNPEEIREPVSGFARFFPNRTCRNTEFQGIWTSLRIGIDLELFAFPAKLYQTPSQPSMMAQRRTILQHLYPAEVSTEAYDLTNSSKMIDLEEFYAKLLPLPSQSSRSMNTLQPAEMRTPLLPFQRRSIAWLLQRERASNTEQIFSYRSETWEKMTMGQHAAAIHVGYSRLTGKALPIEAFPEWISETENAAGDIQDDFAEDKDEFGLGAVRGSMLCDEMGLGKTLEVIALIMLNRTQKESVVSAVNYDQALEMEVTKVPATLIVIPETLIGQWRQELKQYAPTLKVMVYEGWKSLLQPMNAHAQGKHAQGKRKRAVEYDEVVPYKQLVDSWMHEVGNADVVLTTFGTVQMDWAVAPPPVKRARRSCASYVEKVRPLSALLLCHWHRVAIDEIQELDIATASKAANMIKTIKRDYSLAISGTPAKTSVEDLASSLVFLGVTMPTQVWNKIITPAYSNAFHAIFSNIAIRHVKSGLSAQEMNIPSQHRFLVPVKLSSIEWAYYKETYEANIDRIQRSERGYTDPAMLRNVLHVLRMVSSHIQVGLLGPNPNANGSRAVRLRLDNRIMPILDALQRMEEDAEAALFSSFIEMSRQQIKRAMLLVFQSSKNWKASVRIYSHLAHQLKDLDTRLAQLPADRESPEFNTGDQEGEDEPSNGLLALGLRRHALRLLEHEIAFRLGDVYSSKDVEIEDRSQQEDSWYSTAARLRSELLNSSAKSANDHRSRLTAVLRRSEVHDFGEMEIEYPGQLGLLSQRVQEPLNLRIDCLNDNAEFLWNTRAKIITALMEAVESDGSGEKDYQQTLQEQHDLEAYMWIYQAALADRTEFLVEERNALAVQADRAEAVRQAEAEAEAMVLEDPEASAANKEVNIRDSLVKQRNDIRNAAQKGISLKAAYIGLNGIRSRPSIRPEEEAICRMEIDRLKAVIKTQTQVIKRLTDEFMVMNSCFNRRIAYYKALQGISDTVAELDLETDDVAKDLERINLRIVTAEAAYDKVNARRRYLQSVRKEATDDMCPICQEQLGRGPAMKAVILGCLHRLCAPCYGALCYQFYKPVCPTCRRTVKRDDDIQKIVYTSRAGKLGQVKAENADSSWIDSQINPDNYNIAAEDPEVLSLPVKGSWGSKLDRLIRQLRFWRETEPEVKHIIFSSWKDALSIVEAALNANNISWRSRTDKKDDKSVQEFTEDPDIHVFLLHGERENSGLTLTAASVCHLLEPVINSGFELQAIGRVDRLGQMRETTVYCYATLDTVEERIVDRARVNHTSLYATYEAGGSRRDTVPTSIARKGGDDLSGSPDDILDLLLA